MSEILKGGEAISLVLAIPVFVMCWFVVREWFSAAREVFDQNPRLWTAASWFTIGVMISFVGELADNFYWNAAWSASYIGYEPIQKPLFRFGVVPNIPFRQLATIFAGYCHVRSAIVYFEDSENDKRVVKLNRSLAWSVVGGFVYLAALTVVAYLIE